MNPAYRPVSAEASNIVVTINASDSIDTVYNISIFDGCRCFYFKNVIPNNEYWLSCDRTNARTIGRRPPDRQGSVFHGLSTGAIPSDSKSGGGQAVGNADFSRDGCSCHLGDICSRHPGKL